jgi:hypothetical protein
MSVEDSETRSENSRKKETRHERFVRIATRRTNTIIEKIRILANLSDPRAYEYTTDEVDEMFGAIERELKNSKSTFSRPRSGSNSFAFGRNKPTNKQGVVSGDENNE